MRASFNLSTRAIVLLVCLNAFSASLVYLAHRSHNDHYTYHASDYPVSMPVNIPRVAVTFNALEHFPLLGQKSDPLWFGVTTKGVGNAQLGPNLRLFGASMYHELHCLRLLNAAFGRIHAANPGHVRHCLGYLRSMALCYADTTLEPGDFATRASGFWTPDTSLTCSDTSSLRAWMDNNYEHWVAFPNGTVG